MWRVDVWECLCVLFLFSDIKEKKSARLVAHSADTLFDTSESKSCSGSVQGLAAFRQDHVLT